MGKNKFSSFHFITFPLACDEYHVKIYFRYTPYIHDCLVRFQSKSTTKWNLFVQNENSAYNNKNES